MPKLPSVVGPILLIIFYLGISLLVQARIPAPPEFIKHIAGFYGTYGYPLIFLGAILEAMFLIGLQVPGSTIILLGAALAKTGVVKFPLVFFVGVIGLVIGYMINYLLGRYGWYHLLARFGLEKGIEAAKKRIEKYGVRAILVGYFFPGSASFLSTAAGILQMPFKKFLLASFIAQSFWGLLWGTLAYLFGLPLVEFMLKYFIFVLIGIGAIWLLGKLVKR